MVTVKWAKLLLGLGILTVLLAIAGVVFELYEQKPYVWGALHVTVGTVGVVIYLASRKKVFEIAFLPLIVLQYILFFHILGWL